jgi:hypothetical protein
VLAEERKLENVNIYLATRYFGDLVLADAEKKILVLWNGKDVFRLLQELDAGEWDIVEEWVEPATSFEAAKIKARARWM